MLQLHTFSPLTNLKIRADPAGNPRRAPMLVFCGTFSLSLLRIGENRQGRVSRRCYCSRSSPDLFETLQSKLPDLHNPVSPSVVPLLSYFSGSKTREIQHSAHRGTGVLVAPNLIVTPARVVGIFATVDDESERDSVIHKCFIARTVGLTVDEQVLRTTPVAVNFARDVAVLEILNPKVVERGLPPPCAVANAVAVDNSLLLGITRHQNCSVLTILQARQPKSGGRPKAPWPLDDELEWIDYGACDGQKKWENEIALITDICGSPWFNLEREVVGIASWTAEAADGFVHNYAVHPMCIRSVVDYAKNKGPHDPIVMDPWINAHAFPNHDLEDINKECMPPWSKNIMFRLYVPRK